MPDSWFQQDLRRYGPQSSPWGGDLAAARSYCQRLAQSHYENFSVLTFWVRGRARYHMHSVYAFSRWADNLADEVADTAESTRLLAWWRTQLNALAVRSLWRCGRPSKKCLSPSSRSTTSSMPSSATR